MAARPSTRGIRDQNGLTKSMRLDLDRFEIHGRCPRRFCDFRLHRDATVHKHLKKPDNLMRYTCRYCPMMVCGHKQTLVKHVCEPQYQPPGAEAQERANAALGLGIQGFTVIVDDGTNVNGQPRAREELRVIGIGAARQARRTQIGAGQPAAPAVVQQAQGIAQPAQAVLQPAQVAAQPALQAVLQPALQPVAAPPAPVLNIHPMLQMQHAALATQQTHAVVTAQQQPAAQFVTHPALQHLAQPPAAVFNIPPTLQMQHAALLAEQSHVVAPANHHPAPAAVAPPANYSMYQANHQTASQNPNMFDSGHGSGAPFPPVLTQSAPIHSQHNMTRTPAGFVIFPAVLGGRYLTTRSSGQGAPQAAAATNPLANNNASSGSRATVSTTYQQRPNSLKRTAASMVEEDDEDELEPDSGRTSRITLPRRKQLRTTPASGGMGDSLEDTPAGALDRFRSAAGHRLSDVNGRRPVSTSNQIGSYATRSDSFASPAADHTNNGSSGYSTTSSNATLHAHQQSVSTAYAQNSVSTAPTSAFASGNVSPSPEQDTLSDEQAVSPSMLQDLPGWVPSTTQQTNTVPDNEDFEFQEFFNLTPDGEGNCHVEDPNA